MNNTHTVRTHTAIGWRSWPGVNSHYVTTRTPPTEPDIYDINDTRHYQMACGYNVGYYGEIPYHQPTDQYRDPAEDYEVDILPPCEECLTLHPLPY